METRLISCIIPVFNGERYLAEALESVVNQTYRPVEILVVDDGSTDNTAAGVSAYRDRIRYRWQPNAGQAAARNLGLTMADGQFVAFLDADDVWHPEKLARQMARFEAREELDCSFAHVQNFWIPELIGEQEAFRDHRISKPIPGYSACTLLCRRALFETLGAFDTAIHPADDTDWFLRASERGATMEMLPEVLLFRRLHQTNMSRLGAAHSRDQYLHVLKNALDRRRAQKI